MKITPHLFCGRIAFSGLFALVLSFPSQKIRGGSFEALSGAPYDEFGYSVAISGNISVAGAVNGTVTDNGTAYVSQTTPLIGANTEHKRLDASDSAPGALFGSSVAVSGSTALVGARLHDVGANADQGAGYIFRNVDTGSGPVTQDLRLLAGDGAANDQLGRSAALSGNTALLGAHFHQVGANPGQGAAYVFRNVHLGSGNKTHDLKLVAGDGAASDFFGASAGLSGNIAVVGATHHNLGALNDAGAAYIFRGVNTANGTINHDWKLIASDAGDFNYFGISSGVSGGTAVVGALNASGNSTVSGAAYVFRGLGTGNGTKTEDLKLVSSDGGLGDWFGHSVSISGDAVLVGAPMHDVGSTPNQGAAYLFLGAGSKTGTWIEDVKIVASSGTANQTFGHSVALDGDKFVIGAPGASTATGKAYTGSVSSMTVLDSGSTFLHIDYISFYSTGNWVIGHSTDSNAVTLTSGDSAYVTAPGTKVYIGRTAASDANWLRVDGVLHALSVAVGDGTNINNSLRVYGTVNSAVDVMANSFLEGNGTVNGSVHLQGSAYIDPVFQKVDELTIGSSLWEGGAEFFLDLLTDGTGTAGSDWDTITVNGALTLNATASNPFIISLRTMSNPVTYGALASWDPDVSHTWSNIVTTTGGVFGFSSGNFVVNTSNFLNTLNGTFSVVLNGNNLDLVYTAVPEPSAAALCLAGLMAVGARLRRGRDEG